MSLSKVHFSSLSVEWSTPQGVFDELNNEFHFTLDPCASVENAKCAKFFTKEDDGLKQSWRGERVFMNPPYGREIGKWIKKAYGEWCEGALVVCLIPSRTDTSYWHDFVMRATEIRFIRGRLYFNEGGSPAPFPSAVIVFNQGG